MTVRSPSPSPKPSTDTSADAPRLKEQWKPFHGRHRQQQHDQTHRDSDPNLPPVLDDPSVPQGPPDLVDQAGDLRALLDELVDTGRFAYDTEFIGERSYHPQVCVVQVATTRRVALIDGLAGLDLRPLWELIADPGVQKVVHAGQQDLEPIARRLGQPPATVFDTQIAAGFADMDYPLSLRDLCEQLVEADLGAGLKFSQWDARPLTPLQIGYAANDVRYLPLAAERILERLDALGTRRWAMAACDELGDLERYKPDPLSRRVKGRGAADLKRKQLAVLQRLLVWRESVAEREDLPPRVLLADEVVINLAIAGPKAGGQLQKVKGLPHPVRTAYGKEIVAEVAAALDGPLPKKPKAQRPKNKDERADLQTLWDAVKASCQKQRIAVGVVTNKAEVTSYWWRLSKDRSVEKLPMTRGWRAEILADVLEQSSKAAANRQREQDQPKSE